MDDCDREDLFEYLVNNRNIELYLSDGFKDVEVEIYIENISDYNRDHRGDTHCKLDSDFLFEEHVSLTTPFTVDQLAEALFRIKSHKWDKWYELYSSANFSSNVITSNMSLKIGFDHGS